MKKYILGIRIDDINIDQAVKTVEGWLGNSEKKYIVTPNPEFIVMAQGEPGFTKILNDADLSIPDGIGLKIFGGIKNRVTGVDLMEKLIALSAKKGFTVGLLGGRVGVAEKLAERLKTRYQTLSVVFAESGGEVSEEGKLLKFLKSPKSFNCDLLFVAFGQGKQERWIANNLDKQSFPFAGAKRKIPFKVAMGVGGAFDYLSGNLPRAPKGLRDLGLEWLFRLILQPWRIKRQWALVKFIWLMLK